MISRLVVDIGDQVLAGVHMVPTEEALPQWLELSPGSRASANPHLRHVGTNTEGPASIRSELLRCIDAAQTKVFFCSFIFADQEIMNALCRAAARLRGGVYVVSALERDLEPDMSDLSEDEDDFAEIRRRRRAAHGDALRQLAKAGVWLRDVPDCHAKFCVVDDRVAVVTSANATEQAYERNPENAVVIEDTEIARELGRAFAQVWLYKASNGSPPGQELDVKRLPKPKEPPIWVLLRNGGDVRPVMTLGSEEASLMRSAVDIIDGATSELVIATYSVVGIERHPVGEALRSAVERGVRIGLLVRPRNHVEEQRDAMAFLFRGISSDLWVVRGHRWTHAKCIVADREHGLLWTGNLDGEHGWTSGIEVGVHVRGQSACCAIRDYAIATMASGDRIGVLDPSLRGLAEAMPGEPHNGRWVLKFSKTACELAPSDLQRRLASEVVTCARDGDDVRLGIGSDLELVGKASSQPSELIVASVHRGRRRRSGARLFGKARFELELSSPLGARAGSERGRNRQAGRARPRGRS